MPVTVPVLRDLEPCRGQRPGVPLILRPITGQPIDRRDAYRIIARVATAIPRRISAHSLCHAAITYALEAGVPLRDAQILWGHADPRTTEHFDRPAATATATASTSSPPTSPASHHEAYVRRHRPLGHGRHSLTRSLLAAE
jgi:hypothetical protein